ncbi:MAG: glycosyltransferase family 2 protein [Symploca sp. SIO1B1]|nr:glycosyltransferase family 2 protein [Symploca sp. SIO1B1]
MQVEQNLEYQEDQDSSLDFTVAIRAYNSQENLPLILDKLRSQLNTQNINWEIVLVDNNSTDDTAKIVQEYQSNWCQPYPLRYYLEPQQGAIHARWRAIREARGQLIGFLDDDNFPDANWVSAAYSFAQSHPQAGVCGSQVQGKFEVEPPKNFKRIQAFLAIKEHGSQPRLYNHRTLNLPAGAGMVIRKQVWLEHVPEQLVLQGPVGKSLSAKGEDFEGMIHIGEAGWEIWYNPQMLITHQIPASRLERDYLLSLIRSAGLNVCTLRLTKASNWQKPVIITRIILGNLRRIVRHWRQYRGQYQSDLVAACEMEFFVSGLLSPWFYLKRQRAEGRREL